MRTSFHHEPEAQHPNSSAIHKLAGRLPHPLARLRDRKSADRRPLLGFGKSRYAARLGVGCPRPRLGRHLLSDHPRLCIGFPSNLDKWR